MTNPPTVLYTATVALFDGSCVRAWTELFTDREVAQAWSEWKYQLVESRRPVSTKDVMYQDSFMVMQYPIDMVYTSNIEDFTEDNRYLVDDIMGGGSA